MNIKPTTIIVSYCLHGSDYEDIGRPSTPDDAIKALGLPQRINECEIWNVEIIHYAVATVQDKTKKQYEIKAHYA